MERKNLKILLELASLLLWWLILCTAGCSTAEQMTAPLWEKLRKITIDSVA